MTQDEHRELLRDKRSEHQLPCPTWSACRCFRRDCPRHYAGCKCHHMPCPTWQGGCKGEDILIPCAGCKGKRPLIERCLHCHGSGQSGHVIRVNHVHSGPHVSKDGLPWCAACQDAHVDPHPAPVLQ